jgi:CubicO group peptidase (beta-lactamase class C family)
MIRWDNMPTQTLVDSFEEGIPELMEEATVPGLTITLIQKGSIVWSQAFGVRDWATQEPVTRDTLFEAASLSKPLFAYASLKLCEKGVLDLDTPLVEYMPDDYLSIALPTAGPSREQLVLKKSQLELVTTRHVLSHTAGSPNWPSKEQPLKRHFVPGERFAYSGTGFAILQSIVEIITGLPAVEYIQENILEPFGMKNSRLVWTGQEDLPVALGHNEKGEPTEKALWLEMIAGASLHSTPTDFARFMLAVMRPSTDNPYHLSLNLTKEMLTPQVKVNDSATWHEDWPKPEIKLNEFVSWGLGWGIQHTATGDSFWHWGDNGNYQNFAIGSSEEGFGIVVMTNGKNGQQVYQKILYEIIGGEYPALDWLKNL